MKIGEPRRGSAGAGRVFTTMTVLILALFAGFMVYVFVLQLGKPARKLATPADRLAGFWQIYDVNKSPSFQFFFTPPNRFRSGDYVMVGAQDMVLKGRYDILAENRYEGSLNLRIHLNESKSKTIKLQTSEDGLRGRIDWDFFGEKVKLDVSYLGRRFDFEKLAEPRYIPEEDESIEAVVISEAGP